MFLTRSNARPVTQGTRFMPRRPRSAGRSMLIGGLLMAAATASCGCSRCQNTTTGGAASGSPITVGEMEQPLTLHEGPVRVVVTDTGDEPKSILRYEYARTDARARISISSAHRAYEITVGAARSDGPWSVVELGVASEWDGSCCPPDDMGQPQTYCARLRFDASGRTDTLLESSACKQGGRVRPWLPFLFTIPWPNRAVGVGAQWTVSRIVGMNRRSVADARYTLLARRGNGVLVALSIEKPGPLLRTCTQCPLSEVGRVDGVARVDLTEPVPLAHIVYQDLPWQGLKPEDHIEDVDPDWATNADGFLLEQVLAGFEAQRTHVQDGIVQALRLFAEERDVEPLLVARKSADPRLRPGIDDALTRATLSEERGIRDWWHATIASYCTGRSVTHAIELLDQALGLPDPKRELRARMVDQRGILRRAAGDLAGAAADFTEALELDPKDTRTVLTAAWWLATAPGREQRDARRALALLKALDADHHCASCGPLGNQTWAAVLAELGQFEEALVRQKAARTMVESPEAGEEAAVAAIMTARENAYEKRQPWREGWIPAEQEVCRSYRDFVAPRR
jgi:hypothetical protein